MHAGIGFKSNHIWVVKIKIPSMILVLILKTHSCMLFKSTFCESMFILKIHFAVKVSLLLLSLNKKNLTRESWSLCKLHSDKQLSSHLFFFVIISSIDIVLCCLHSLFWPKIKMLIWFFSLISIWVWSSQYLVLFDFTFSQQSFRLMSFYLDKYLFSFPLSRKNCYDYDVI